MVAAAAAGFATGLSLILAIGAQNAFVLRQGLRHAHVFWVCLVCGLSDATLIVAGVAGFGWVVGLWPALPLVMTLGGAGFLVFYGALRFRAAWRGGAALGPAAESQSLKSALLTCLALTWLNPHVYLDTLALIGAVSTGFAPALRPAFAVGAASASISFFFALGYGARILSPVMASPRAWAILDVMVGLLMWAIAAGLLLSL